MKGCSVTIGFERSEYVFVAASGPQLCNKMIHNIFSSTF